MRALLVRLFLAVALVVAGVVASVSLDVSTSLTEALPAGGEVVRAFEDAQRFALLDTLVFEVDGREKPEALADAVRSLGAALERSGEFVAVRASYGVEDGARLRAAAGPSLGLLTPAAELEALLTPAGLRQALGWQQARLFGPAGALAEASLRDDPLGLAERFTARAATPVGRTRLHDGVLVSEDGTHGLLFARPRAPATTTTPDGPLMTAVRAAVAASPLPVAWFGAYRSFAEAADQIRGEIHLAVTADTVLMVLVFLVAFRSLRPLAGALPALLVAGAGATIAARLHSPVHGVSLAFGGALAGLGVDYWIHLYLTALRDGAAPTFAARLRQGTDALRELLPAYAISVSATAAAFLLLASSAYQAVSDLGWIGLGTITGAFVSVLLLGPTIFAALARPDDRVPRPPLPERVPWPLAAAFGLAFVVFALAAGEVRFEGDPRVMDARLPETAAIEAAFAERYGSDHDRGLLVAEGPTLDAALDALSRAEAVLAGAPGLVVVSPDVFLPGPEAQAAAREAWRGLDEAAFTAAALDVGFEPAALLPALRKVRESVLAPTPAAWAGTPGEDLLARTVRTGEGKAWAAALIDATYPDALRHARHELQVAGVGSAAWPEVRLVEPSQVARAGAEQVQRELYSRSGVALAVVALFMALRYRDVVKVFAATLPSLVAAAGTLGFLAWQDVPLTPASGPALALVLGIAFDQGIFLVEAERVSRPAFLASRAAILIALATAVAGFSGLLIATHPAVRSVGVVVTVGIVATFCASFGMVPAVLTPRGAETTSRWLRRAFLAAVLFFQLDGLVSILGWIPEPTVASSVAPSEPAVPAVPSEAEVVVQRPEGATTVDRRLGPNRLIRRHGLWAMRLEGEARGMGRAAGVLAGDIPERNELAMEEELKRHVPRLWGRYLLARATPLLAREMAAYVPAPYLDLARGWSEVVPDPFHWLAPAYTRKVTYHAIHDLGQAMVDSPLIACTGFVAAPDRTGGPWLLARNFDFDGGRIFDEDKAVVYEARAGAIPFVHVGIVGLFGVVSGVNAEGIALAVLAGASDAPPRPRDPMIFIIREALERARSLEEVRRVLDARRGFVSEGILAVDAKNGAAGVFEVSPDDVHFLPLDPRGPNGGVTALSNHFRGPRRSDAANNLRMIEGTSVARLLRMEELVASGTLDEARAVAVLRDRGGLGGAELPRGHEAAINADIASHGVVIDATARTLTVSTWPNLAGAWVRYALDDMAAGNLDGEIVAPPDAPERSLLVHEARELVRRGGEENLREALRLNPGDVDASLALGLLLRDAGRFAEARPLLEAVAAAPERASQGRAATIALERGP